MKRKRHVLWIFGGALLLAGAVQGAEPAPMVLSPQVAEAIKQLSADTFEAREKAVGELQQALAGQLRDLVSQREPEAQARMAAVMEFNDGLSRWALEVLKLPAEQRARQLQWGTSKDVYPVVANVYSARPERRVEGVRQLGKLPGEEATAMLARLLTDDQREVYVAAMDAVWDRAPTAEVVDALWQRSVEAGLSVYRPRPQPAGIAIRFRGRNLGNAVYDNSNYRRMQDNDIATETLIQIKAPQMQAKLVEFLERLEADKTQRNTFPFLPQSEPMKNVYRLLEAYQTKAAVPVLVRLATAPIQPRNVGAFNNQAFFWSNRTAPLAMALRLTGQNLEDFKIRRSPQMSNMWVCSSEADEDDAVKQLEAWWGKNKGQYTAASQPASRPGAAGGAEGMEGGAVIRDDGAVEAPEQPAVAPLIIEGPVEIRGPIKGPIIIRGGAKIEAK